VARCSTAVDAGASASNSAVCSPHPFTCPALVRRAAATTMYITHDQAEAFALAGQAGVLEGGRPGLWRKSAPGPPSVCGPVHRPGRRAADAYPDRGESGTVLIEPPRVGAQGP
jgi:hypothetical protein